MFGSFRRHQNWLWYIIIAVIIITFVFWGVNDSWWRGSDRADAADYGSMNGRKVTRDEYFPIQQEARLDHFLQTNGREWPSKDEAGSRNLERSTLIRLFLIEKTKELNIRVSDAAVVNLAKDYLPDIPLSKFEEVYLVPNGLNLEDFQRFLLHEAAIQQLRGIAAASAKLFNPREADLIYRKRNEEVTTELAVFWSTNFLDKVTIALADVANYYTNHMSDYRIPDRIRVTYVAFNSSNYLVDADARMTELTNLNSIIDQEYYKRGGRSLKDTNGVLVPENEAKSKIKLEIRETFAVQSAHKAANSFGTLLMERNVKSVSLFENLAASNKLTVLLTPPFDKTKGFDDPALPSSFEERAFKLSPLEPVLYSPILGEKAVHVIALKDRLPSENPPLDKVQAKVTVDFKNFQARDLARQAGTNFYALLTNGLAQKKSFTQLCAENKVKVVPIPAFSPSTTSLTNLDERVNLRLLQNLAFDLEPDKVSSLQPTQDGAVILHLRERLPFLESKVKAELPEFMARIRYYRHNESFNNWFRKQVEQSKLALPVHASDKPAPRSGVPQ